jgi:FKBP-type peptidyl-prolyl cis-trans isomerase FklB
MRLPLALLSFAAITLFASAPASAQPDELPAPTTDGVPAGQPAVEPIGDKVEDQRFNEKLGYCLGLDFGKRLAEDETPVDLGAVVAGLKDGLTNAKPQLTDEQIAAVMEQFQITMLKKVNPEMAQQAEENLTRGTKFLAENRAKEGVEETPSGLQYRVITEGDGDIPTADDTVSCHYEGTLISGEVFDSSYKRGKPAEFPVGGVIAGWTEALQKMKVGSKWEVFLPAKIAYGLRGAPGAIGPNETLVFTIELLDIVD